MLGLYYREEFEKELKDGLFEYKGDNKVLLVKLISSFVLFLFIFPHVNNGMLIMKYTTNNFKEFVPKGAIACYILGLLQVIISVFAAVINLLVLSLKDNVEDCIFHFITVEVIMEI